MGPWTTPSSAPAASPWKPPPDGSPTPATSASTGTECHLSRKFAEDLAALCPFALLCEGTNLETAHQVTEAEVLENCLRAVQESAGKLVVADFAPRNVERLVTFLKIARQTGRCLAIQPRDAYLLLAMRLADPDAVPDPLAEPCLALYEDPKVAPSRLGEGHPAGLQREAGGPRPGPEPARRLHPGLQPLGYGRPAGPGVPAGKRPGGRDVHLLQQPGLR